MASLQDFYTRIEGKMVDSSGGVVERSDILRYLNEGLRKLRRDFDPPNTKRISTLEVYTDETEYPLPADFKSFESLQDQDTNKDLDVHFSTEKEWRRNKSWHNTAAEKRDGATRSLLLRVNTNKSSSLIHDCDSLTADGTWAADTTTSDASGLVLDQLQFKQGTGSFRFNVTVAQSANNYAEIRNITLGTKDLTSWDELGVFFVWVFLPTTSITNVQLFWGNSTTVHWNRTATTAHNGAAFVIGWNRISFDWNGATETGTVDPAAIDFAAVRINYAASFANTSNFRIDHIIVRNRLFTDLHYYSDFMVSASGTLQEDFASDSDTFLADEEFEDLLEYYVLEQVYTWHIENNEKLVKARTDYNEALNSMSERYPSTRSPYGQSYYDLDNVDNLG